MEDFDGHELELWIFDAGTGERIGLARVRHFPGGAADVVISDRR